MIYKHKRGGLYRMVDPQVLFVGAPVKEGDVVCVYLSLQDGMLYVRSSVSFFNSERFVKLDPHEAVAEVASRNAAIGIKPRGT